ncbi:MAG: glycosyl hydrolase-related protein [Kiritimatiellae bacterium]|nr:glycosyl hydrolase-related protein [Kiritimatiellia bacterium]
MAAKENGRPDFCLTLANHWSYTGIGWQLGLESCAASVRDSLAMADYDPSVKTCLNLDALAYELVAEHYPDIAARLRQYVRAGRVELIGGSYGQPMGSMVSGESNLRQLVVGQQTIRKAVGRYVSAFLEEEEFSHPQVPQLIAQSGYRFASLAQCDTWGKHGSPRMNLNCFLWRGVDGTKILTTPVNDLVFHPPAVTHDIDWLWSDEGRQRLQQLRELGMPLVLKWTEFGWETLGGQAVNKFDPAKFRELSRHFNVRYTTLTEYLDTFGGEAKTTVSLAMNDFEKLLPWGVGGDQLRRFGREVESVLLAAERFDAAAHLLGLPAARLVRLEEAWKKLLIAQSHDVSLCEYSRNGGGIVQPLDPIFDTHFLTWGSIGFRYMDEAKALGRQALDRVLHHLGKAVNSAAPRRDTLAITTFNPCAFEHDALAQTGRLCLGKRKCRGLRIRDSRGRVVPSQLLAHERDAEGNLVHANVSFAAKRLPSVGYDSYYLEPVGEAVEPAATDLRVDEKNLTIENAHVSLALDPVTGGIARLTDRRTGRVLVDGVAHASPRFTGRPNPAFPLHASIPEAYDSATSKAAVSWVERGPLRVTVRAFHPLHLVRFETLITLCADSPAVHVRVRVFCDVPPRPEPQLGGDRINAWQYPLAITEGYWLRWTLGFAPRTAIRDYPFGVEATPKAAIEALSFVDFLGGDRGLLVIHDGTQYFQRDGEKTFATLVMREWESPYTCDYGWPRAADYRYVLVAHGADFSNGDRLRAVAAFDGPPICRVDRPHGGRLPARQSFVSVQGDGALLSAFRRSQDESFELRMVECAGGKTKAKVSVRLPIHTMQPTDFLGTAVGDAVALGGQQSVSLHPWEIKTFQLRARNGER